MLLDYQKEFLNDYMCEDLVREMDEYIINQTVNNKKEGLWKRIIDLSKWGDENLYIYEEFYKGGLKEGIQKLFYENGDFCYEFKEDDKLEGVQKCWYDNVQLWYEHFYNVIAKWIIVSTTQIQQNKFMGW